MGYPERPNPPDGNTYWQNAAPDRYEPSDGSSGYPGFHTYATSDLNDDTSGNDGWPDNWSEPVQHEPATWPDDDPPEPVEAQRDYMTAAFWAAGWLCVPLLFLLGRALLLSGEAHPSCSEAILGACASPRAAALADLMAASPFWAAALLGAITLALVLRWASDAWRALTIGFCAAVVAGGATTVLHSIT